MQPWICSAWGVPSIPCLNRQICNKAKWPPACQSSQPTKRPGPGDKVLYFWLSPRRQRIHYLLASWKIHFYLIIQMLSQKGTGKNALWQRFVVLWFGFGGVLFILPACNTRTITLPKLTRERLFTCLPHSFVKRWRTIYHLLIDCFSRKLFSM